MLTPGGGDSPRAVAELLTVPLTQSQVTQLADHLDFGNMKKNPGVNHADRQEK